MLWSVMIPAEGATRFKTFWLVIVIIIIIIIIIVIVIVVVVILVLQVCQGHESQRFVIRQCASLLPCIEISAPIASVVCCVGVLVLVRLRFMHAAVQVRFLLWGRRGACSCSCGFEVCLAVAAICASFASASGFVTGAITGPGSVGPSEVSLRVCGVLHVSQNTNAWSCILALTIGGNTRQE